MMLYIYVCVKWGKKVLSFAGAVEKGENGKITKNGAHLYIDYITVLCVMKPSSL